MAHDPVSRMLTAHDMSAFLAIFRPDGPENYEPQISLTIVEPRSHELTVSELIQFDELTGGVADIAIKPLHNQVVIRVRPESTNDEKFWTWVKILRFFARSWNLRFLCAESR